MKAIGTCPKCGKVLETKDPHFIEWKEFFHNCDGKLKLVKGINWKSYPEDEKDLRILEQL